MHKIRKLLYGLLVVSLLVNLVLPTSLVIANTGQSNALSPASAHSTQSVTNATYGNNTSVTDATYKVIKENIITSVTITDKDGNNIILVRPNLDEYVKVDFKWRLDANHKYGEGSTFTFQLPDKFKVERKLEGSLSNNVGTYVVTPEGQVTFTFSDIINGGQELEGDFHVWRYFNEGKFTGGTHQNIDFQFEGDAISIPVHFKGKDNGDMTKSGLANKGMNASEIDWIVDINTGEKKIEQAAFSDTLPSGLSIDMSSIQLIKLDVQLDGKLVEREVVTGITPQSKPDGFELQLGDIHNAYRVKYKTKITGTVDASYTNKAAVTGNNLTSPFEKTSTVNVRYSKPLGKTSVGYDDTTQTITWAIQYNYNEQSIGQAKAYIEDTFDKSHQQLDTSSFEVLEMRIDDNGNAIPTGVKLTKDIDYTVDDNVSHGFTLNFSKDIQNAYEIKYKTKAINRVHDDSFLVTNQVTMPDHNGNVSAEKNIGQVIFHKYADNKKVNYADKTISWQLDLNADNKTMNNVVITDNITGQNMTFIEDSLIIIDENTKKQLEKGKDFTIAPNAQYTEGFTLTFLNPIVAKHSITYKTKFDPTAYKSSYKNSATLNWDDENNAAQKPINKTATITPDSYTKGNGNKRGAYDATTKEITWTIDINYNLHTVNEPILRDFYTGTQNFVKDSLKVNHLTLDGAENKVTVGKSVPASEYTFTPMKDTKGNDGFELKFNNSINTAYRITYKTSLAGLAVGASYSNQATLVDGAGSTSTLFNKTATVRPQFPGEYVLKKGKQGKDANSEFAYWQVHVNRSQSYIAAGSTLTDTLSENQLLLPDTVKLYHYRSDKNGNLSKGNPVNEADYTLHVKGNTLSLTFNKDMQSAYLLEYTSFINAGHGEEITNKVSFKGQFSGTTGHGNEEKFKVEFSGAGGGATIPQKGNIKVVKKDKNTNLPLAGAKFGLYDKNEKLLLQELITDTNGEATFNNFKYNDYFIKELEAPAGYLIDTQRIKVTLNEKNKQVEVTNTKDEWDIVLTKVDADTPSKVLEGAVFKLQMKDGNDFKDVAGFTNLKSDKDGQIPLQGLKPGDYQLIEVTAPHGYKIDTTPIPFTVVTNQGHGKPPLIAKNKLIKGSVEVTKVDKSNPTLTLKGAVFQLQDSTGKVLRSGLTTTQDGKLPIDDLVAGSYQLVETTAPTGYQLNSEPLKFDIVDENKLTFTFENEKLPGSLKLIKTEIGKPAVTLSGAQFRLLDENKQPLTDKAGLPLQLMTTDSNGQFTVPNLKPGTYFAEEVVAPNGFMIEQKLTMFEIVSEKETTISVENKREPLPGSLKFTKIEAGKPTVTLPGAQFRLLDESKQPLTDKAGLPLQLMTTDSNGQFTVPNLKPGTYFAEEVVAPNGFMIEQKLTMFEIISEQETAVSVENKREPLPGSLKLTKVEAGKPAVTLPGAQFRLLNENKLPATDKTGLPLQLMTTDSNGQFIVPNLKPGTYFAEEVVAPKGYVIEHKLTTFQIVSEKETTISVENKREPVSPQPPVVIPPVDGGNETPNKPDQPDGGSENNPDNPTDGGSDNNSGNPTDGGSDNDSGNPTDGGSDNNSGNPTDGGTDNNSGNPTDGGSDNVSGNPSEGGSGKNPGDPSGDKPNSNETPDQTTDGSSNKVLPKTGEDSPLTMQLTGLVLMLLGAALLVTRKRWLQS